MRWCLLVALCVVASPLCAQSFNYADAVGSSTFIERVTSDVSTRTAGGSRVRQVERITRYVIDRRGDTLMVRADSMTLTESVDGSRRPVQTDGFVGGQWKVLLARNGAATIAMRPFVPDDIAEVSDPSPAMDDFFPFQPPVFVVGGGHATSDRRTWQRLADSGGVRRFHWSFQRSADSSTIQPDPAVRTLNESVREDGDMVWDPARGPLAWRRVIVTRSTSRVRSQVIEAMVRQEIVVRRVH